MPVKNRHSYKNIGAVGAAASSAGHDVSEGTAAILHLDGTAGAVVTIQASPDKGANWYPFYKTIDDGTIEVWTFTLGAAAAAIPIPFLPGFFRISVTTQAISDCYLEALRDV
jgi:hypothetical protein